MFRWWVVLPLTAVTCLTVAFQDREIPLASSGRPDYGKIALQTVREELTRELGADKSFSLGLVGDPVLFPDHQAHHWDAEAAPLTIQGIVKDPTGGVLPGCQVVLQIGDGQPVHTVSDIQGRFRFLDVPDRDVTLMAELPGFRRSRLQLKPSKPLFLEVLLHPGEIMEVVDLEADSAIQVTSGRPSSPLLPDALTLILADLGSHARTFLVTQREGDPAKVTRFDKARGGLPLTGTEWARRVTRLKPFYDALLDVEAGPDRFEPFFDRAMLQRYAEGMGGSKDDVRLLVISVLDVSVYSVFYAIEDLGLPDFEPWAEKGKWKHGLDLLQSKYQDRLEKDRAWSEAHKASLASYVRRLLGEGLIVRGDIYEYTGDRAAIFTRFSSPGYRVYLAFAEIDGTLKLVSLMIDD